MKKAFVSASFLLVLLLSCRGGNDLEEVQIPDPEVETTQTAYGNPAEVKVNEGGTFKMKGLKYAYDDLQPHIDGRTLQLHYAKHHLNYANKLNKEVDTTNLASQSIEDILRNLNVNNKSLRNNAGGYYNHNLYFEILGPKAGGTPSGALAEAITAELGSFDALQTQLTDAGNNLFGSGWVWLVVKSDGKLAVTSTSNQDNPLMPNAEVRGTPILAIDVWEHAYYLSYQNKRNEYLTAIFNVIDWKVVNDKYESALARL
jgi:Fe-Mn family superoxide dismutase